MNTTARAFSLVQEGIRNFERPLFVDQLGMQGRQHYTVTDSTRHDDAPPPFSDRPGTQERRQEGQAASLRGSLDVERGVQDLARVLPFRRVEAKG